MKKYILLFVIIIFLTLNMVAQEQQSITAKFVKIKKSSGIESALTWFASIDSTKEKLKPTDEKEFIAQAKELRSFGYVEETIRFLKKASELFPLSSALWENLGSTHIRLLQKEDAVVCFQKAVEIDPKNRSAQGQMHMIERLLEDTRYETREKMKFEPGESMRIQGEYLGQKPPGLKPVLFAPGIVSVFGSNENTITFSPNGKELYFGKESGIWVCKWKSDGWTAPENTGFKGYEMWIYPRTGNMYYTGYEPGIWMMEKSEEKWGTPVKIVPQGMFSTLTNDGILYTTVFSDKGKPNIGRYILKDGKYDVAEVFGPEINTPNSFDAHPNIAPDGSYLIFDSDRAEGNGLYISFNQKGGSWNKSKYMGNEFNGSLSTFSPDGKYLFFMKHRDIYWVSAKIIEELRPKE